VESALSVKGLRKSYGSHQVLKGIDLEVVKGSIIGLLGHNGEGKSTTIECILGTRKPDAGEIHLLGKDPRDDRKELFQKVGVQFQQSAYEGRIKVKEVCQITHSLYNHSTNWPDLLSEFGLAAKANAYVADLSGGQQQKLSIILAVMNNPEFVFFDELTTGLDPKARRDIWKYIHSLKDRGITIFLTSHYMDEVENLCDNVALLKDGHIYSSGTVDELITQSGKRNMDEAYLHFLGEE